MFALGVFTSFSLRKFFFIFSLFCFYINSQTIWDTTVNSFTKTNLFSITYGNGIYAAVGDSGTIITSVDGYDWKKLKLYDKLSFTNISLCNNQFFAGGSYYSRYQTDSLAAIYTSIDAINWIERFPNVIETRIKAIQYGNNKFVSVCYMSNRISKIITSDNVIDWKAINIPDIYVNFESLLFANEQFIAIGKTGPILVSTDGVTWNKTICLLSNSLSSIAFGNDKYVLGASGDVNAGYLYTSADCLNWSYDFSSEYRGITKLIYENSQFLMVTDYGKILSSSNGLNWITKLNMPNEKFTSICFGNKKYIAVGQKGRIIVSPEDIIKINNKLLVNNNNQVIISKNSQSNVLHLNFIKNQYSNRYRIYLYSLKGNICFLKNILYNNSKVDISIKCFSPGIYLLKIVDLENNTNLFTKISINTM